MRGRAPVAKHKKRSPRHVQRGLVRLPDPAYYPALLPVYVVAAVSYLTWRTMVINWNVWYGPAAFLAETYGALTTMLFLWITRYIEIPLPCGPTTGVAVDILIPTYNESLEVLEPTVRGARAIRGAGRVLVLDDGNRDEVRAMAGRLGVDYLPRTSNKHAKAGNLNNGLAHSEAEFVVTFDADHVPVPEFLERTLGYFEDPQLAFVQTPQTYYNTDSLLFRKLRNGRLWSEQAMFYDVIQPAKNRWNSSFFVGTSAVLRRSALDDVGGFATGTATEDIHTSLRLHARGWRSLFVPEPLAFGLEAESLREFYKQRLRWAAGSLGLLFRSGDSPLWARGLTRVQRVNYLSSTLAHAQGLLRIFYFLLPLLCVFTLVTPVDVRLEIFAPVSVTFIAASLFVTSRYARGTYHPLHTEAYNLFNAMAHLAALRGVFRIQRRFSVSKKRAHRAERTWTRPLLWVLLVLAIVALARAVQVSTGGHRGLSAGLVLACSFFIVVNLIHLGSFLNHLYRYEHQGQRGAAAAPASPVGGEAGAVGSGAVGSGAIGSGAVAAGAGAVTAGAGAVTAGGGVLPMAAFDRMVGPIGPDRRPTDLLVGRPES